MKKLYLLLSIGLATTANSFAMITKLSHTPKNTLTQVFRLNSTKTNSQNTNHNDFQAINLYLKLRSLQVNIAGTNKKNDLREIPWDYFCGTTPWEYYKVDFGKSAINSWSSIVSNPYIHINEIAYNMDNASENLPSWLNQEKIKQTNNSIKQRINENLTYIENHNNFLIQHHNELTELKKKFICTQYLKKCALKKELNTRTHQLHNKLIHNNKMIFQNLNAIDSQFWSGFVAETEKRNKTNIE
jgi:hypothetical protein